MNATILVIRFEGSVEFRDYPQRSKTGGGVLGFRAS